MAQRQPAEQPGHSAALPPNGALTLPTAMQVWTTCPMCAADVAFVTPAAADTATELELQDAEPEVVLALTGASTVCPQCETVLTFLVEVHVNIATAALPGGRASYPSDAAFLRAHGWTQVPAVDGTGERWHQPGSPFALPTEAAIWHQRQLLLRTLSAAERTGMPVRPSESPALPPVQRPRRRRRG